jgi:acetyl-CoA carboxylase biotin carboxyl carrier protein
MIGFCFENKKENCQMELKDIKKVVQMMKENDLTEFLLEDEDCTLQLKRGNGNVQQIVAAAPQVMAAPAPAPATAAAAAVPEAAPAADDGLVEITSPMVGTFYSSPSPDADAFVVVGASVSADSVVCIVEAMKVMNEITADVKGTIKKILVDNATPVQFGQPLFLVEPA